MAIALTARFRRLLLAKPSRSRVALGAAGAVIAVCAHLFPLRLAGSESVSVATAVVTVTGLIAGWLCAAVTLLFLTAAAWIGHTGVTQILVPALVALLLGELLRVGVRPVLLTAILLVAILLPRIEIAAGVVMLASTRTLATAVLTATLDVALATAVLMVLPRRGSWVLGHRRATLDDGLFVLVSGAFVAGVLAAVSVLYVVALGIAALLLCFVLGRQLEQRSRRLLERLRAPPGDVAASADDRPHYGNLPREVARLFLASFRQVDHLRRQIVMHRQRVDSIREHVARLRHAFQTREQALRGKEAELAKALSSNESTSARWRAFADAVPDVLLIADRSGRIEFVNAAVRGVLGFTVESLLGKTVDFLVPDGHSGSHPLDLAALRLTLTGNAQEQEVKVRHAALGDREVAVRVQPLESGGERSFGIRLRDVSGLKYILSELKNARTLVEAAQRSSGQFIAMMSHEIRTPLHGLMATLDMLRDEALSAEGRHRIGIARVSARTLLNIANDILDLTRIDTGAFPLEHKPFDLARLVREVADEARARADSLGLTLTTEVTGALPRSFLGDPARIKQILSNLVSNALKFTPRGGVRVIARFDGQNCILDVIDSGEGVPHEMRESIFDPFIQAESSTARRTGGAGLGLPISRRLSQAMGGNLVLAKTGPEGSTFRVTLALAPSDEEPLEDQSQRILKNPPGRILVVEDHPANQYVAQTLLESLDCTVTIAGTGPEALELLREREFDLVFMDCQMPGMDGYETTRRMRSALQRYVPVIAMTANAMVDDKQRCLDAGMDDFLPKPFTKSALSNILCKWLVPGANVIADGDIAERLATLPPLDSAVFEELWESLQWRLSPLRKIYESFMSVAQETLDILESSPEQRDAKVLGRRLHTVLGSAGMVGARQIERLAAWLDDALKAGRREELEAGHTLLADGLQRFEKELDRRLDELSPRRD
jgi:PAS domain S-box-containing protein